MMNATNDECHHPWPGCAWWHFLAFLGIHHSGFFCALCDEKVLSTTFAVQGA
jgi:hypothetical protein